MTILPSSLHVWSNLKFVKKKSANEWSAECPNCGDVGHVGNDWPDRFRMWDHPKPRGWCRGCGYFAFADGIGKRLSPAELAEIERNRKELAEKERKRVNKKITRIREEAWWRGYHDRLDEMARQLWADSGIPAAEQDWWELGYNPEYKTDDFTSPALTIPYFKQGEFINMQSRLLSPPVPSDKYRFLAGLPTHPFLPDKDSLPHGSTILVEGAKKAMVIYLHLGHKVDSVVGLVSKHVPESHLALIGDCDPVYVMLDPDAHREAEELVKHIGNRARLVAVPVKPDDYIVKYGASGEDVWGFIQHGRSLS